MSRRRSLFLYFLFAALSLPAGAQDLALDSAEQTVPAGLPVPPAAADAAPAEEQAPASTSPRSASDGSILTRRDARAITQRIPAPRGQITDRNGKPLAQSKVSYLVALQYRQFESADRDFVVGWGRARLSALEPMLKKTVAKSDDELWDHYRHRRWLPLHVSGPLDGKEAEKLEKDLPAGLELVPIYLRHYPEGELAAHIIGYTGTIAKMPTGPINVNEPMWEESEGRSGLEKIFDSELSGEPGQKRIQFDEHGNMLLNEQTARPRVGGTVVTTLNLDWQKRAEQVLRKGCRRGALVVLDVVTGEVLVMASRPSFDLNLWVPRIDDEAYKKLNEDPATPLYGRAFQSRYPPASAFKPVVALTALNSGKIKPGSTIDCPAGVKIGNHVFNDWSRSARGALTVRQALSLSNNPWFIKAGLRVGPTEFLGMARRLGMGERTGLPLVGETAGLVPDNDWMLRNHKRRIMDGDTANMSIGQGSLEASPLQVAQLMAGIANGGVLPKLQLITQIQDSRGRVVKATVPERRTQLGLNPEAVAAVRRGMADVVTGGTGRSGALSFTKICGKTGTAQWVKRENKQLAWFAGFLPYDNPRFAFAVLYEGRPGERLSGGRTAAPMVRSFFEPLKKELQDIIAPPLKAAIVVDEDEDDGGIPAAVPVDEDDDEDGEKEDEPWNDPRYDAEEDDDDDDDEDDDDDIPSIPRAVPADGDEVYDEGVDLD